MNDAYQLVECNLGNCMGFGIWPNTEKGNEDILFSRNPTAYFHFADEKTAKNLLTILNEHGAVANRYNPEIYVTALEAVAKAAEESVCWHGWATTSEKLKEAVANLEAIRSGKAVKP